ncbi:TPA: CPBP family intramembrane metalloprotease [Candidatus Bathyarchaeota archaeon]|nr:CPBP family intramembrane metalloprotease [Candidatus Bathyarchaeota archaeon]
MKASDVVARGQRPGWWLGPAIVYLCWFLCIIIVHLVPALPPLSALIQWSIYIIPLSLVYCLRPRGDGFWRSVGLRREGLFTGLVWTLALGLLFDIIIAGYVGAIEAVFGFNPSRMVSEHFERVLPDWYFACLLISSFVPTGLVEELVFRGYILDRFLARGPLFAVSLSSLMFSLMHLWYATTFGYRGLPLFGMAFLMAVYFGLAYSKSRNVVWLVVFHGINNVMGPLHHFFGARLTAIVDIALLMAGAASALYIAYDRLARPSEADPPDRHRWFGAPSETAVEAPWAHSSFIYGADNS